MVAFRKAGFLVGKKKKRKTADSIALQITSRLEIRLLLPRVVKADEPVGLC